MPVNNKKNSNKLRPGFSTGACVAACTKAAYLNLEGYEYSRNIDLLFPDGKNRTLKLENISNNGNVTSCSIKKDAGSDPDITNGIRITCSVGHFCDEVDEIDIRDYIVKLNESLLIVKGEEGIGTVTRSGVAPPVGKWAINPMPLKMIEDNLKIVGFGKTALTSGNKFYLKIKLQNGKELSRKTLNPLLGIVGGLSILGTSGIVVPYSHSAYIETIRILITKLDESKYKHIVLATGAQSVNSARKVYPELGEEVFIRIADFIADSLKIIREKNIEKISIACMPGKLFKYACSFENTNAKFTSIDTGRILTIGKKNGIRFKDKEIDLIKEAVTVREAVKLISSEKKIELIKLWSQLALDFFKKILNKKKKIEVELMTFDYNKDLILLSK